MSISPYNPRTFVRPESVIRNAYAYSNSISLVVGGVVLLLLPANPALRYCYILPAAPRSIQEAQSSDRRSLSAC